MNELALFSGTGGGILGTRLLGWRVVCAVEINPYCREVLLRRQEEGILQPFPIWDDVRYFDGKSWCGKVDIITAGFPCQGYSVAGKQLGEYDERNLWPDTIRIIREVRPRYCLLENVPGLLAFGYFGIILRDLSESGYNARWKVISAAEVGAPHLRNRVWIMAYSTSDRSPSGISGQNKRDEGDTGIIEYSGEMVNAQHTGQSTSEITRGTTQGSNNSQTQEEFTSQSKGPSEQYKEVADTKSESTTWIDNTNFSNKEQGEFRGEGSRGGGIDWWAVEPELGRVADGVAYRVDRLKALGEGQVPAVVRAAWELLS